MEEAGSDAKLLIIFLSDGAPSDHNEMVCMHGVQVWQPDFSGKTVMNRGREKLRLQGCETAAFCRGDLKNSVLDECVSRISDLGDLLGRDRLAVHTVAFGPPNEEFSTLQASA